MNRVFITLAMIAGAVPLGCIVAMSILWFMGFYFFGLSISWPDVLFGVIPSERGPDAAVSFIRMFGTIIGTFITAMTISLSRH